MGQTTMSLCFQGRRIQIRGVRLSPSGRIEGRLKVKSSTISEIESSYHSNIFFEHLNPNIKTA